MKALAGQEYMPYTFQPHLGEEERILPEQFFDKLSCESGPIERRLMLAVLEDAIAIIQRYQFHERKLPQRAPRVLIETRKWILSSDTRWPYSFENICAAFNFDAEYLRKGIFTGGNLRSTQQVTQSRRVVRINPKVARKRRKNGTQHASSHYLRGGRI